MSGTSTVSGGAWNLGGYLVRDTNGDKLTDQISPDGGKTWVSTSSAQGNQLMSDAMNASIGAVIQQVKQANHPDLLAGSGSSGVSKKIIDSPAGKAADATIDAAGKAGDALQDVGSALNPLKWAEALASILNDLLSPFFWERIGMGALGLFLIVIGVVFMVESNKTARQMTSTLAETAVMA